LQSSEINNSFKGKYVVVLPTLLWLYQFLFNYLLFNITSLLKKDKTFSYTEYFKIFLNNKTNLFLVLSLSISSIIAYPFLIPHLTHTSMSYHIIIHIISLNIAIFLTTISFISFRKSKSKKLLLTAFSFMFLLIIEIFYLLQASHWMKIFYIPLIEVEFSHLLLLGMLILFACGVLRVDKK
jgi:hypothetical protein